MTTIEVTKEDIANGKVDYRCCPIALAGNRATGKKCTVGLAHIYVAVEHANPTHQKPLPQSAVKFREDFDAGKKVRPITFQIDL